MWQEVSKGIRAYMREVGMRYWVELDLYVEAEDEVKATIALADALALEPYTLLRGAKFRKSHCEHYWNLKEMGGGIIRLTR